MEPLHPDVRAELKKAYPALDDAVLDEYDRLTHLRMTLDPDLSRALREEVDAKRSRLIAERMPQLAAIETLVTTRHREREGASREGGQVTMRLRRDRDAGR